MAEWFAPDEGGRLSEAGAEAVAEPGEAMAGRAAGPAILVGFDGSPSSEHALAYAAGLSRRMHGSLAVAYVAPSSSLAGLAPMGLGVCSSAVPDDRAWARRLVQEVLGDAVPRWELTVVEGDVAATLERLVVGHRFDMVVVGRSRSPAAHLLGSVPARLARRAPCPMIVVP